jgi:hypothetical protein
MISSFILQIRLLTINRSRKSFADFGKMGYMPNPTSVSSTMIGSSTLGIFYHPTA